MTASNDVGTQVVVLGDSGGTIKVDGWLGIVWKDLNF